MNHYPSLSRGKALKYTSGNQGLKMYGNSEGQTESRGVEYISYVATLLTIRIKSSDSLFTTQVIRRIIKQYQKSRKSRGPQSTTSESVPVKRTDRKKVIRKAPK